MSRDRVLRRALTFTVVSAGLVLAGCGKQGVLQQPPPLFGAHAKAEYRARKAQEERDDAQRNATLPPNTDDQSAGDNAPRTRHDVKDPAQILSPASSNPVVGAPDPMGPKPPTTPGF